MPTVTLTTKNTNYDLATLLLAAAPTARIHGNQVSIQAEAANAGDVLVGDPSMTASTFDARLQPGDFLPVGPGSGADSAHVNAYTVRGDNVDGLKVSVSVSL